ncbi:MAG: ATP-binding protein, partial [Planctomycetota bacterium]
MVQSLGSYAVQSFQQKTNINATAKALDEHGNSVVLRAVQKELLSPGLLLRLEHEAKRLRQIDTPSFNRPIDMGVDQEWAYLAYKFIDGVSLDRLIQNTHSEQASHNPIEMVLDVAKGCLTAVDAIHAANLVHRDIRSSHIFRKPGGKFVLAGYGPLCLAQAFGNQGSQALEFASFASPELAGSLEHDLTPSSDIYSIGIVLFHTLMGRPPFEGEEVGDVLFRHLTTEPSYEGLALETPDVLVQFINRMMEKDVRDRYQNAFSALADLRSLRDAIVRGGDISQVTIGRHDTRSELTEPSFVGREREMLCIKNEIAEVVSGEHRTLIAVGKSGMGKSRLLLEAKRVAAQRGFSVFQSVASDQATQEPLAPLLTIVDQLAKHLGGGGQVVQNVAAELVQYKSEIATAMPNLAAALNWDSTALSGPEEMGQGRIVKAFSKVLAACASRGPALICIDDCQWLDKSSVRVIEDFAAVSPSGIFLLIGSRPNERMSEEVLRALPQATELSFGELESEGIFALAESMAGKLPANIKNVVVAMSAGSPFLANAAMRGLVESQTLLPASPGWRVDDDRLKDFQASADSASILLKRLEFIDDDTADLLAVGAVIGKNFQLQIPVALTSVDAESAFAKISKVRAQGLVWSKPDGTIAFVHDKIREAVVSRIPAEQRSQLHGKIAQYLQKHEPSRCFDLAYHFDAADLPEFAWRHALIAAGEAKSRYALDTAEAQYRIAARALTIGQQRSLSMQDGQATEVNLDRHQRHEIEFGLANVVLLLGKYDDAALWLDYALSSAPQPIDAARVRLKQGDLAFKRGNKGEALDRFEQALRDAGNRVPRTRLGMMFLLGKEMFTQTIHSLFPRLTTGRRELPSETERLNWTLYSKLAQSYWYVKDKYYCMWAHLCEMNRAERYQPTLELAQAYSEHAPAMSLIPWHKRGVEYGRRSLRIRKDFQDMWGQGQSRNFLSIMFYSAAQFDECMSQAQQAISVLERTGDYWEIHMAQYQYAAALYRIGRLKDAADASQALYHSAIELGDDQSSGNAIEIWVRSSLGAVPNEAIEKELSREKMDHQAKCQLDLAEGVKEHLSGRFEQAIACFERAIEAVKRTGVINAYISPNYTWLATSLRAIIEENPPRSKAKRQRLIRRLRKAIGTALRIGRRYKNELPQALREAAILHCMEGDTRKAEKRLRESMEVAEEQGANYEFALTERELLRLQLEVKPSEESSIRYRQAQEAVGEIEAGVLATTETASLSLMDRFEALLHAGQQIVAGKSEDEVLESTLDAAKRLLRGDRLLIIESNDTNEGHYSIAYPKAAADDFDPELLRKSNESGTATLAELDSVERHGVQASQHGAFLACPILLNGSTKFFIYVANTHFNSLFGDDECRIASYLASAAGGALERADGWGQLEALNESLEQRVQDRTDAVVQRSRELEETANALRETQSKLEKAKVVAERASESKSDFLACMSHEIRTPMSAVLGFTEILQTRDIEPETQTLYLRRIQSNGEHLLALINDVLDFSKIEADRLQVEQLPCNALELTIDAVAALESRAAEKSIELQVAAESLIPETIHTDPTRLRQIVMNLVGNAIKFTEKGGVEVALSFLNSAEDPQLVIQVKDTGIGISKKQIDKIFDPFTQADASTTRQFGGTGLGLSICKRLSEALGGGIEIESVPELGSKFTVTIATGKLDESTRYIGSMEESSTTTPRVPQAEISLAGKKILVADDVSANREIIEYLLSSAGADVQLVENGQQALEAANQQSLDLIVLDMQMPVKDGYSTARELRATGCSKPIVAMTANNLQGDREKCIQAGCDDYLTKPIDFDLLLNTADRLCNSASQATAKEKIGESSNRSSTQPMLPTDTELRPFCRDFLVELFSRLDQIDSIVQNRELDDLLPITHEIRGSSGTLNFTLIEEAMERMEDAISNQDRHEAVEHFERFLKAYRSACDEHEVDL